MHLSTVQWLTVFVTLGLQVATVTIMVTRKFRSVFPMFFAFTTLSLTTLLMQAVIASHLNHPTYFYLYWVLQGAITLLSFAIVYEVFVHILKNYPALVDLGKLLFRWAFVFLAIASTLTAFATEGSEGMKIVAAICLLERASQLMLCGLLLLFILFEGRLGLSWRSPAVAIVLGVGVNASLVLAKSFVEERLPDAMYALDIATAVVCVAIYAGWFACFALPQPERRTAQDSPTRLILQRWNEALMATPLVPRRNQVAFAPVESFLPGVEQTVERVMARKMMH